MLAHTFSPVPSSALLCACSAMLPNSKSGAPRSPPVSSFAVMSSPATIVAWRAHAPQTVEVHRCWMLRQWHRFRQFQGFRLLLFNSVEHLLFIRLLIKSNLD